MKKLFIMMLLFTVTMHSQTVNYTANNTDDVRNPERGLYYPLSTINSSTTTCKITDTVDMFTYIQMGCQIDNDITLPANISLIQRIIRLDAFKTTAQIPASFIALIRADFVQLRSRGLKCILRFSYSNYQEPYPTVPPLNVYEPTKVILLGDPLTPKIPGHIAQLGVLTREFEDVISSIEAGFIGNNGEWDRTTNFGYLSTLDDLKLDERKQVGNAIMTLCPNRMVAFRTPRFQRLMMGSLPSGLSNPTPTNFLNIPRIAAHNDCFVRNIDDEGTYGTGINDLNDGPQTILQDKTFLEGQSTITFDGGETCGLDPSYAYATCDLLTSNNVFVQLKRFHFSYLNSRYHPALMNSVPPTTSLPTPLGFWFNTALSPNGGCLEEIKRNLGYRFQLISSNITGNNVSITLQNVGYANVFNERKAYLVLKNSANVVVAKVEITTNLSDVRNWNAAGTATTPTQFTITKDLTGITCSGTYKLYLEIPDSHIDRRNDSRYSIRLLNKVGINDIWESTPALGLNNLYRTINLTGLQTPPTITGSVSANLTSGTWQTNNQVALLPLQTVSWTTNPTNAGNSIITNPLTPNSVKIIWSNNSLPATIIATVSSPGSCTAVSSSQVISTNLCDCLSGLYVTMTPQLDGIYKFRVLNSITNPICSGLNLRYTWTFPSSQTPFVTTINTKSYTDQVVSVKIELLSSTNVLLCSVIRTYGSVSSRLSVNSTLVNEIKISPNPSKGIFNMSMTNYEGKVTIQVLDMNGRIVYETVEEHFNNEKTIDLSNYQSGMYIVKVNGENINYSQKLIKQ